VKRKKKGVGKSDRRLTRFASIMGGPSMKKARLDSFDRNLIHMTMENLNVQPKIVPKIKNIFIVIYDVRGEMERTKEAGSSGNACVLYLGGAWFVSWLVY